jgi:hypothetical protein
MATASEIQSLLDKLNITYQKLGEQNPFANFDINTISDTVAEAKKLEDALKGAGERLRNMSSDLDGIVGALKAQVVELGKSNNLLTSTRRQFTGLASLAVKLRDDQEGINRLSVKELVNIKAKIESKRAELKDNQSLLATQINTLQQEAASQDLIDKHIDALAVVNQELKEGEGITEDLFKLAEKRLEQEERINESLGITGNLLKGAEGFMNKMGLGALSTAMGFDGINKELKEFADKLDKSEETLTDFEKKQKVMSEGFKLMKGSVIKALTDPLAIASFLFTEILSAIKSVDEETGKLAKSMNLSYSEANSMRNELQSVANTSMDVLINTKGLQETLIGINAELGTSVMLNSENLKTFTQLREASGLTLEDQKGLIALTNATKGNAEDITKEFLGQAKATSINNKAVLNEKTLLKEISSISAATTLSLGKDAGVIGKTIATVKALGMEMGKVDSIANSLLDFESSIESELSAELLLNKDLNLEKARQFALNNDLAGVASEISKQAGSAAEFSEMNRIQQDALAKAVGMSREELADTLFLQEQIANVSEEDAKLLENKINNLKAKGLSQDQIAAEMGKESLDDLKNQASVQERLNKSVEKLREVFISIAGPIMSLVSPLLDLANLVLPGIVASMNVLLYPVTLLADGVNGIIESFKTGEGFLLNMGKAMLGLVGTTILYKGVMLAINAQKLIGKGLDITELMMGKSRLVQLAAQAVIWAIANPFRALAGLAIAGTVGAVAYGAMSKAGDINSPSDGKTQISTKEGGLFELSKNDDIVAFPGASKMMNGGYGGGTTVVQQDNSETNNLLKQLISTNQQGNGLLSKQPQLSAVGLYEVQ